MAFGALIADISEKIAHGDSRLCSDDLIQKVRKFF
jgi:hypothetical protein